MDSKTTISKLKKIVQEFCEEREWDQFHNPKDLAIDIINEASELLEHFRYKSERESIEIINNPSKKQQITQEVADILFSLMRLSQKYNIDLSSALINKIKEIGEKYPVEKAKGSNKKYNEF